MKKSFLFIFMALLTFEVSAFSTIVIEKNGYKYKNDHWDEKSRNYRSLNSSTYRAYQIEQTRVRSAVSGAVSAGTVQATVTQDVNKRAVTNEILRKARTAGRALGKGAATLGRGAVSRHPLGLAFALALEGLAGSKFQWNDDEQDFVKYDDNKYVVLASQKEHFSFPNQLDERNFGEVCQNGNCQKVAVVEGKQAAQKVAEKYCQSRTFRSGDNLLNFDSVGHRYYCYSQKYNTISSTYRVKVVRWLEYVPITEDEFFDESEPDADRKPNEWVETAKVKPTDEPKIEVKAGSVAQSDPYTDPKDRKVKQTRWDFDGKGKVRETVIERPDLTPGSPEAPELKPPVEETPKDKDPDTDKDKDRGPDKDSDTDSETDKDKQQSDTESLCEKHPEVLACQGMGEVKEGFFDDIEIPQVTDEKTWEEDRFLPSNGTCPSPKTFHVWGKPFQVSYEPLCRLMQQVRFIILIAFIVMSAYLVFGSLLRKD